MGREHDPETVWQAQELYCVDRMTFEQVAEALGVADSTLRRWADTYGWRSKRDEIAQAESDLRADKIRARSKLLKSLISTADAQTGFAVAAMENLALKEIEAARALKAEAAPRFQEQQALPEVPAEAGDIAAQEQGAGHEGAGGEGADRHPGTPGPDRQARPRGDQGRPGQGTHHLRPGGR